MSTTDSGARERPWSAFVQALRRLHASIWTTSGLASQLFTAVVVFAGAVPFAGWALPGAWLAAVTGIVVVHWRWRRRGTTPQVAGVDPFFWLLSAAYALAAFYLVFRYTRAAQTLGVTLSGVIMFQVLAHDYASLRRLIANLMAPIALVALALAAGSWFVTHEGEPWKIVTIVATPLVVLRTFLAVRQNLNRNLEGQRDALAALAKSEGRYRLLAESSPDLIVRCDLEGRIEYLSPAARAYGWDPELAVGRSVAESLDGAGRDRTRRALGNLAFGRSARNGKPMLWRTRAADGASVWFEGRSSPMHDEGGRIVGAMTVLRDVTERLALEAELHAKRAEAEAAAVAKSEFLANMSHEIRTPLTGVVGFAGLLREMHGLPADAQRYAERIASGGEALLAVVNDVLDFSKLEAGQLAPDPQAFDARELIEGCADLVRGRAKAKAIALNLDLAASLPDRLLADGARLRQVLLNLATNAVKFTDAGSVTIEAGYDAAAQRLRVAVRDTGLGIAEDVGLRLFQRFSQADASSTRAHGGTGLGLAISKSLIEMMGGQIGFESQLGAGSTFWFEVPAPVAAEAPADAAAEPTHDMPETLTLLVVDDVAVNRELVATMLAPFGVTVFEAESGPEAIAATAARRFDLILMDLQMPGMDGLAATRAIRAGAPLNRATPILALSASVLPEQVAACAAAGMNDHIAKPIRPAELLGKIARWSEAGEVGQARAS